jgi:hypothetical protein
VDLQNVTDPKKEAALDKANLPPEEQAEVAQKREESWRKNLELLELCIKHGKKLNVKALFADDPVFSKFVNRERSAILATQLQHDIAAALTFCRFLQKNGATNSQLDYDKVEY